VVAASGERTDDRASEVGEHARPDSSLWFWRFIAFYTISVIFIYSVIRYKTPWCVLSFLHGAILLAGVGAVALVRWMPHVLLKAPVVLLVVAGMVHLGWQAYRLSFDPRLVAAPSPLNPYTYSQPRPSVERFIATVENLAKVSPQRQSLPIVLAVPGHDYWPLPWYLRTFPNWVPTDDLSDVDVSGRPPAVIVALRGADEEGAQNAWLDERYTMADFFELRPSVILPIYVENGLWQAYIETRK
jgi:predicted membrane-bound mannosyltransferase